MKFTVTLNVKPYFEEVEGYRVSFPGFEDFRFILHNFGYSEYVISEETTGLRVHAIRSHNFKTIDDLYRETWFKLQSYGIDTIRHKMLSGGRRE